MNKEEIATLRKVFEMECSGERRWVESKATAAALEEVDRPVMPKENRSACRKLACKRINAVGRT